MPPPVPGTPATVCIAHPVFLFLVLFPPHCRVRLSVSSTDDIILSLSQACFWVLKMRPIWVTKTSPRLPKTLEAPTLGPNSGTRKLVLGGTSSHCSDLASGTRGDAKASPSHLSFHLLEASFPGSHTHMEGPPPRGDKWLVF